MLDKKKLEQAKVTHLGWKKGEISVKINKYEQFQRDCSQRPKRGSQQKQTREF